MKKYKLDFLLKTEAIKCGKLEHVIYNDNPYDGNVSEIIDEKGVYIIISDKTEYIYPKNKSKVIYIGKADNFFKRISQHHNRLISNLNDTDKILKNLWDDDKYMYMRNHGANVYFLPLKYTQLNVETEHQLESEIMLQFYQKYQALPVGNKSRNLCTTY